MTVRGASVVVSNLVHLYSIPEGDVVALKGVDLEIRPGEVVGLLGPSGMGKSTLLQLLAGMFQPSSGRILLDGVDISQMKPRSVGRLRGATVALVLQGASRNLVGYATVGENLWFEAAEKKARARITEIAQELGIQGLMHQRVNSLSGGQQQLVAIAAGVVRYPKVLLVDEPTSQLDHVSRDRVIAALLRINETLGLTVVIVTHDPVVAQQLPRSVLIRDGRIGAEGRYGEEFAVVGRDGTVQIPPDLWEFLAPDTLVSLHPHSEGIDLRHYHEEGDESASS